MRHGAKDGSETGFKPYVLSYFDVDVCRNMKLRFIDFSAGDFESRKRTIMLQKKHDRLVERKHNIY